MKFEGPFNDRDESDVNAFRAPTIAGSQKCRSRGISADRRIRFTVPFRKTITIAGGACAGHAVAFLQASDVNIKNDLEIRAPGMNSSGTRNEGVGEHVRTRFHLGLRLPVKLRR